MDALPILWLLWTFSSAGVENVGTYPSQMLCVKVEIDLSKMLHAPPRVGMFDTMCLPTINPGYRPETPHTGPKYGM